MLGHEEIVTALVYKGCFTIATIVLLPGEQSPTEDNIVTIRSYDDFVKVLSESKITDSLVTELTKGLVGWPSFKEVFTGESNQRTLTIE